ncbi:MAG: acyltransferase [Treponema sp.]|nr:acyltransferase [Treponema sp.]
MTKGEFSCIIIQTANSKQQTAVDPLLSKRVNSLRFLLIIFVVIIHNGISTKTFSQRNIMVVIPDYVENVQRLIGIITAIAVPMFFLFSAYFLYFKEQKYIPTMKKKCRTILLPYFLWNLLLVLFYYLVQTLPFTRQFFMTNPDYLIKNYGVIDWIDVFWGKITYRNGDGHPLLGPFWFLRDLFILNIFFIGIKKLIDKFPIGIFILFFILWTNNINIYIVSPEALLFFAFGYYIVKYDLGIKNINEIKILDLSVIYGITIILEYFFVGSMPILHKINILIGCMFILKISQYFIENIKLYKILDRLEKYQFFVYAAHIIIMSQLLKIYTKVIPLNGVYILVGYFFMIFFGIFVSLIFGIIFKKLLPKLYGILTGGRI